MSTGMTGASGSFDELMQAIEEANRIMRGGSEFEPIRAETGVPHLIAAPDVMRRIENAGGVDAMFAHIECNPFAPEGKIVAINPAGVELLQQFKFMQLVGQ